ncbi:MAG TPA: glycosyltransferase family 1 protein [Ktedonobacter sp.]|nr:glycosyltransferase family 1 protein [Ktedonobacter sp.]
MRVGINAQLLSLSQNYRNGGVSRYISSLVTELAKKPGKHEYIVFVNGQEVIQHLEAQVGKQAHMTYVAAPWAESRPATRVAWEQLTLPRLVTQYGIDVLHAPVNVLPERLPRSCATVVTLHDLAFMRYPQVLTRSKRLYHRTFTVRSLQRATLLIAVSESTKQDVHELLHLPAERVQVVYPCIPARFSDVVEEEQVHQLKEKYNLTDGFLLYLGTIEPRKNISMLIRAYAQLRQTYKIRQKLVVAGGKGWMYESIFAQVQQLGLTSEVFFPGFVSDDEQSVWYHAASVFAYPSLYEGFGFPVAEALACGTPVVTSNVSSLPEAGAGIAVCVNPNNEDELIEALHRTLTDDSLRAAFREASEHVREQFSAQRMAERTIEAYERAKEMASSARQSTIFAH